MQNACTWGLAALAAVLVGAAALFQPIADIATERVFADTNPPPRQLKDYDVALNSLDTQTLKRSLAVLKRGGKLFSISGPPDPEFARKRGMSWMMQQVMGLLSRRIRREARSRGVAYGFVFMEANGAQLAQIADLVDQGKIRPVIDRVFAFEALNEALAYVDTGRAKGKVVVAMKSAA